MRNVIEISCEMYDRLHAHLLQTEDEHVAFLYARVDMDGADLRLDCVDLHLVPPEGFTYQSGYHVSLADDQLATVIKEAWTRGLAVIEAHSHPDARYPAAFSGSDLRGFSEVVPHMFWRLRAAPYVALVMAPTGFDALVWRTGPRVPEPLDAVLVEGRLMRPTGITIDDLRSEYGYHAL
jgi:hypothetical protein